MSPGQFIKVSSDRERDILLNHLEENTNVLWGPGVKPTDYKPTLLKYPYIFSVRGSQLFAVEEFKEISINTIIIKGIDTKKILEKIDKLN